MGNRRVIQSLASLGVMATLAVCASDQEPAEVSGAEQSASVESKWGYFDGDPVTKWNPDGRTMTLLTELRYTDPQGVTWVNIGTLRYCTTYPTTSTTGRGRIATACSITQCVAAG